MDLKIWVWKRNEEQTNEQTISDLKFEESRTGEEHWSGRKTEESMMSALTTWDRNFEAQKNVRCWESMSDRRNWDQSFAGPRNGSSEQGKSSLRTTLVLNFEGMNFVLLIEGHCCGERGLRVKTNEERWIVERIYLDWN